MDNKKLHMCSQHDTLQQIFERFAEVSGGEGGREEGRQGGREAGKERRVSPCHFVILHLSPLNISSLPPSRTPFPQVKFQTLVCVDAEQRCQGVVAIGDLVAYFIID